MSNEQHRAVLRVRIHRIRWINRLAGDMIKIGGSVGLTALLLAPDHLAVIFGALYIAGPGALFVASVARERIRLLEMELDECERAARPRTVTVLERTVDGWQPLVPFRIVGLAEALRN